MKNNKPRIAGTYKRSDYVHLLKTEDLSADERYEQIKKMITKQINLMAIGLAFALLLCIGAIYIIARAQS